MPIDFPNSPAPNEIFTVDGRSWKWNTVYWEAIATSGPTGPTGPEGNFNVSPTAPSSPFEGDVWYDSDTGQMFVRYDGYWVESSAAVAGPTGPTGPIGPAGANGTFIQASTVGPTVGAGNNGDLWIVYS